MIIQRTDEYLTNAINATKKEYLNSGRVSALHAYELFMDRNPKNRNMHIIKTYLNERLPQGERLPESEAIGTIDKIISDALLELNNHIVHKKMEKNMDKSLFKGKDLELVKTIVNYIQSHDLDITFSHISKIRGPKVINLQVPYTSDVKNKQRALYGLKKTSTIPECQIVPIPRNKSYDKSVPFFLNREFKIYNMNSKKSKTAIILSFEGELTGLLRKTFV